MDVKEFRHFLEKIKATLNGEIDNISDDELKKEYDANID